MNDYNLQFCHRAGKQRYENRKDITDALHAMQKRQQSKVRVTSYKCGFCDGWHYTSTGMKFKGKKTTQFRGSKKPL